MFFLLYYCYCTIVFVNARYYLYETDHAKDFDFDCLDYYARDDMGELRLMQPFPRDNQIIPFCRRDNIDDGLLPSTDIIRSITFAQLRESNISAIQILRLSVSVDLVERYQAYIDDADHFIADASVRVYFCPTSDQFGSICQYQFDIKAESRINPFRDIATKLLILSSGTQMSWSCYAHLNCQRGSLSWCLDWREVCDGNIDCWNDAIDEQNCDLLEKNECQDNEYRCRNGQCIPNDFVQDNYFTPDCLDTTDEDTEEWSNGGNCSRGYRTMRCDDTIDIDSFQSSLHTNVLQCDSLSCKSKREDFHQRLYSRNHNQALSEECWMRMICWTSARLTNIDRRYTGLFGVPCKTTCQSLPERTTCIKDLQTYCPHVFAFPSDPFAFGHLRKVYTWAQTFEESILLEYICYDEQLCGRLPESIELDPSTNSSASFLCRPYPTIGTPIRTWNDLQNMRLDEFKYCSFKNRDSEKLCHETGLFRCGKKCISQHRLVDGYHDCWDHSDENFNGSCLLNDKHRQKLLSEEVSIDRCYKLFSILKHGDSVLEPSRVFTKRQIPHFPTVCDGYVEFREGADTDETNCDQWQCDNQYTRCDLVWNCPNGQDEARCFYSPCQIDEHPCLSMNTTQLICLPLAKANDGVVDCWGGTDERQLCRAGRTPGNYVCREKKSPNKSITPTNFSVPRIHQCILLQDICDGFFDCPYGDDEDTLMCKTSLIFAPLFCLEFWVSDPYRVTSSNVLCTLEDQFKQSMWEYPLTFAPHFSLSNTSVRPLRQNFDLPAIYFGSSLGDLYSDKSREQLTNRSAWYCHNGLPVDLVGTKARSHTTETRCLCPPSTYGHRCQYQNERVSISLRIIASNRRTLFTCITYLVDSQNNTVSIHSYHQLIYLPVRDCQKKFHFHLLYLTRPKAAHLSYAVRIDIYETETLTYRASWSYPILFTFLPVYRFALQLIVPSQRIECRLQCGEHGTCAVYVNLNTLFCQCKSGWSGSDCQIKDQCSCSFDSLCIGLIRNKNRSICICPTDKYGPRCYLTNEFCVEQSEADRCQNGGLCVPRDRRISEDDDTSCVCPERFSGSLCQHANTQIQLSLVQSAFLTLPDFFLLHFISLSKSWGEHERATTAVKVPLDRDSVTIYWNNPFNMIFAQLFNEREIYLLLLQVKYDPLVHHKLLFQPEKRCPSIRELLNSSIVAFPPLRRVKYYHVPCQQRVDLACFHDDTQYLCVCTYDRRANCLRFDHQMDYNCRKIDFRCENGGHCFQDNITCPSISWCACPKCFFGHRCQLSSKGFGVSLDDILGYQIKPKTSLREQRTIVQVSVAVSVLVFTVGLVNGILSIMTFQSRQSQQVGCGTYLLVASINSILIAIIFALKFVILVLGQMGTIVDHMFLVGQCVLLDFLLKILVHMDEWLYACVSVERAFTELRGISFNKDQSKRTAKWVILIIVLFTSLSLIHEPVYRQVVDDVDEGRRWCIIQYPMEKASMFTSYTTAINIVLFSIPFATNIISALIIIFKAAYRRLALKKQTNLTTNLIYKLKEHKHLFISPSALILLALPRLLLYFLLDCLKSVHDSVDLFLFGYFLSLTPPLLTFMVFVLPSGMYRQDCKLAIRAVRKHIFSYFFY